MKTSPRAIPATMTTSETDQVERFLKWKAQTLKENPDWAEEADSFFLELYTKTYPGRAFYLILDLYQRHGAQGDVSRGT